MNMINVTKHAKRVRPQETAITPQAEFARPGEPAPAPAADAILRVHDGYVAGDALDAQPAGVVWHWIAENHRNNMALWKEEDKARRVDVADAEIVRCKRSIDDYNQRRNDAVEALDEALLAGLCAPSERPAGSDARLSSETAGAMIDRLSILALKIHHMRLQAERGEAGQAHMACCRAKLETLLEQRADLAGCLDRLLWEARCGLARFKTYRQFKMYNDPTLNPELYGRGGERA